MNPLVSLLRWSIKGMRKELTRVPLVGLAAPFYPTPSVFFFLEGRPHTIVWPTWRAGSHAPKLLPLYIAVQYMSFNDVVLNGVNRGDSWLAPVINSIAQFAVAEFSSV